MGVWEWQQACAFPAGEQPDASLPLHVLPLYSLLAPEKQAQVTAWGLGRMLGGCLAGGTILPLGGTSSGHREKGRAGLGLSLSSDQHPVLKGCWDLFGEQERFPAFMLRSAGARGKERACHPRHLWGPTQPGLTSL